MNFQQPMFGVLNINKPADWTSRDVVNRVRSLLPRKTKCGHAGTLDPLATGVLVVCVGKATQLVPLLHEHAKSYIGEFLLGQKSDTDDVEGELTSVAIPEEIDVEQIRALLPEFTGQIEQVPPAYSAIKINGERAYKAARRGDDVVVPPRQVQIDRLNLTDFEGNKFSLSMTCGTGTYVRSIGRDLARRLGTEAVMSSLVRTSIGPFHLTNAVSLDSLKRENIANYVKSPLFALPQLPRHVVSNDELRRLKLGQKIHTSSVMLDSASRSDQVAVVDGEGKIQAIARSENSVLAPQIVFPSSQ